MKRVDQLKIQLQAVDLLRLLHRRFSYNELEKLIGIPKSVIALYVSGVRVPTPENASAIVSTILEKLGPSSLITSRLGRVRGLSDWQDLVLDPLVLKVTSIWASREYRGRVTKVVSAETIGVPLATAISLELEASLVLARRSPDDPSKDYIRGEAGEPPFSFKVFYVPRDSISPRDRVLLVDDLARTGMTLEALAKIVKAAGASIVAVVVIVALGSAWRNRLRKLGIQDARAFIEI